MSKKERFQLIPTEKIASKIYWVRHKKTMVDSDLAELYEVPTKVLVQAIKRNLARFPSDFMFQLSAKEHEILRSQFVTSSWGGRRYRPYAFTQEGVAMLSSVLNSERAIQVNIQIMRTFAKLRELLTTNELLRQKIEELERKFQKHDKQFLVVFKVIKLFLDKQKPDEGFGNRRFNF